MTFPTNRYEMQNNVDPVTTPANDLRTILGVAAYPSQVSDVQYIPGAAQNGANTNTRTLNLYNRKGDGTGTTLVATLPLVLGTDLADNVSKTIPLSGTASNLVLAAGDVLEWESLHVLTGINDPGGLVRVRTLRTG